MARLTNLLNCPEETSFKKPDTLLPYTLINFSQGIHPFTTVKMQISTINIITLFLVCGHMACSHSVVPEISTESNGMYGKAIISLFLPLFTPKNKVRKKEQNKENFSGMIMDKILKSPKKKISFFFSTYKPESNINTSIPTLHQGLNSPRQSPSTPELHLHRRSTILFNARMPS